MSKSNINKYLNKPYKVEISFEPEDNTWVASHPELGRGSCYAIGNTPEEAIDLLKKAKKEFIEFLIQEGHVIPEPITNADESEKLPSGNLVIRIPKTLHKDLNELSAKEGISRNQFITYLLTQGVESQKLKKPLAEYLPLLMQKEIKNITRCWPLAGNVVKVDLTNHEPEQGYNDYWRTYALEKAGQ